MAARWAVETTMFRALAIMRVVVLINTLLLAVFKKDPWVHPTVGWTVLGALTGWTIATWFLYRDPRNRQWPLLIGDLAIAAGAILLSHYVKGAGFEGTLPGFWVMGSMLSWSIRYGWRGGLLASGVLAICDFSVRDSFSQTNYGNLFLLLLGGPIIGFTADLLKQMAAERDRAERAAAAANERARLARVVHDGVLQVLALIQRRGAEAGGELGELGRLAGEQEVALRSLVQRIDPIDEIDLDSEHDLAAEITALPQRATPRVQVAVPGQPVMLPGHVVEEVVSAVRACLHNISDHVGPQAQAWVLLEDLGDRVAVSVRDAGPGIEPSRLAAAAAEGRLGVRESIVGRIEGLGGTARVRTAPGEGTEWEFEVRR